MASISDAINSIGTSLKKLWEEHRQRVGDLERRVKALEQQRPATAQRVPVQSFPAPEAMDPLLTTESDAEFEDTQEEG